MLDGGCKLGWKVDWALRWFALGIDYETHGEDLLDSVRLSSRIVKVIGGEPPETFKYELFLDEKGKKISKKLGNGVSIEQWLKYAPVDSLLYLMFLKPQQAKKMGLPLLPEIVDQYLELVSTWGGDMDSPVPFVSRLSSGPHAETGHEVRALLDDRGPRDVPGHRRPRPAPRIPREVPARGGREHRLPRPARSRTP